MARLIGGVGARLVGRVGATRFVLRPPTVVAVLAALAPVVLATTIAPAAAHHVGTYTPQDNAVSAGFKQVKFALEAGRADVALALFERGALRREMQAQAAALPPALEARTLAALRAGDAREVEGHLAVFFSALARDLALEAARQLARPGTEPSAAAATGSKFLEAIWRYYNLIDFAVSTRDSKRSAAMRLALDDAETYARTAAAPDRLRASLGQIAQILTDVIEASTPSRRNP